MVWPSELPTEKEDILLIGIALAIALYAFVGKRFLQCFGDPIGVKLTMCISRLVMQDWHENFTLQTREYIS